MLKIIPLPLKTMQYSIINIIHCAKSQKETARTNQIATTFIGEELIIARRLSENSRR